MRDMMPQPREGDKSIFMNNLMMSDRYDEGWQECVDHYRGRVIKLCVMCGALGVILGGVSVYAIAC